MGSFKGPLNPLKFYAEFYVYVYFWGGSCQIFCRSQWPPKVQESLDYMLSEIPANSNILSFC